MSKQAKKEFDKIVASQEQETLENDDAENASTSKTTYHTNIEETV